MKETLKNIIKKIVPLRFLKAGVLAKDYLSGKFTYAQDCLYTTVNADFMKDSLFRQSYRLGRGLMMQSWGDYQFHWRAYVVCWVAEKVKTLPGDFVDCGTCTGMLARMVINYINFEKLPKTYYLLDTFKGMEAKYSSEKEMQRSKNMGYYEIYDQVVETFRPFSNVKIIKGPIPDTLPQVEAKQVAFLSIDMNSAFPEAQALEYFWDKMVSGGVVVLDDYGFPGHEEQKRAHDEFAKSKGVLVLPVPTGQGLIFKP